MDTVRQSESIDAENSDITRPAALAMPSFRNHESLRPHWAPVAVTTPARRVRRLLTLLGLFGAVLLGAAMFHSRFSADRLRARVEQGCLDVDDCRAMVHAAEASTANCWVRCSAHTQLVNQARARFRVALEQAAHQERQRRDQDYEQSLAARRQTEMARAEQERAARLAELERQHRNQLDLIAAETQRLKEEKAELASLRVTYLRQLSKEQRSRRLLACHSRGANCDEQALALAEAATSAAERTALIDAQERYVTGFSPRTMAPGLAAAAPQAAFKSSSSEPAPL